ncbi:helix-turn-helix domain-containing protein [Winogradskyella sp.]|uniref:helix-turn-helix domain-containing protein n=1 Tax=Winogradskyella sp. TaxID=1883156 RepID=UPI003BA86E90
MQIIPIQLDSSSKLLIRDMWIVEEANGINIQVKAFPTGYPYINVISGTAFSIKDHKGNTQETTAYISGNSRYPFELNMCVIKRALTIQLQPYAIPYLIGIPADEFSEQRVPLKAFSKQMSDYLGELINSNLKSSKVLQNASSFFKACADNLFVDIRVLKALHEIIKHRGNISVRTINSQLNLSQRRLQQLFRYNLGMSAKSYTEIVKIQNHTFNLLKGQKLDYIVPDGYYDQSHFIHHLKKQTSMSPTVFQKFITSSEHHGAYYVSNLFYGI